MDDYGEDNDADYKIITKNPSAPQSEGYINYNPTKPVDGFAMNSPISNARTYSPQNNNNNNGDSHLNFIQTSANQYGAKPTTPKTEPKKMLEPPAPKNQIKTEKQILKETLQMCTRPIAKKLFTMHKKDFIDLLDFSKSGVVLQLNKLPDSKQKKVIARFERRMHNGEYIKELASDGLIECIELGSNKK